MGTQAVARGEEDHISGKDFEYGGTTSERRAWRKSVHGEHGGEERYPEVYKSWRSLKAVLCEAEQLLGDFLTRKLSHMEECLEVNTATSLWFPDVGSVVCFESLRALKLSRFESFRASTF